LVDGIPSGVDRLKCLGNAIVPQIGAIIWTIVKYYFDIENIYSKTYKEMEMVKND
jgi:hypothetical protein